MREILYRGFHEDAHGAEKIFVNGKTINGRWVYGAFFCLRHNDGRTHMHHFIIPDGTAIPRDKPIGEIQVEVIPETVGQFTGIFACEKKKIFEGDHIKADEDGEISEYSIAYCGEDDYPAFDCIPYIDCDSNGLSYLKGAGYDIEIIGTIYDAPDGREA